MVFIHIDKMRRMNELTVIVTPAHHPVQITNGKPATLCTLFLTWVCGVSLLAVPRTR